MNILAKSQGIRTQGFSEGALSIAICGIRGIPACYGGFETFAEELAPRLVELGHRVVVYGRRHVIAYDQPTYKGVEIKLLDAPQHKYFETPVHSFRSFLDLRKNPVDVVLVCNAANSPFIWLPKLKGMPVAVNLDGIERKRGKWNALGRAWYRLGEICSVLLATEMVADADCIADYYLNTYRRDSTIIRYGCRSIDPEVRRAKLQGQSLDFLKTSEKFQATRGIFSELNIEPGNFLLYVSRLEPENNAHRVIEAYNGLPDEIRRKHPLVVVGDAPYARDYISALRKSASAEVVFAGYRFGEAYELLQQAALAYIQATEVGGTHPALVEAMGYANCVIANGTPENIEVVGSSALIYKKNNSIELREKLLYVLNDSSSRQRYRRLALQRAEQDFSWDKIASEYETLFFQLTGQRRRLRAVAK